MKAIRSFLLALVYSLSTISIAILLLAIFTFFLYLGADSDYPGTFLIWIRNDNVLTILIASAAAMFIRSVREDGAKVTERFIEPIVVWFEKI